MAPAPERQPIRVPTILVIYDDDQFRARLTSDLRNGGYLVLEAHDAESALQFARTHSRPIDLALVGVQLDERVIRLLQNYRRKLKLMPIAEDGTPPVSPDSSRATVVRDVRQFLASGW